MAQIDKNDIMNNAECKHCFHECHCDEIAIGLHADEYGICTCDDCKHEEDYEKEETRRLEDVRKGFVQELRMTKEEYDECVTQTRAKDLITFYYKMEDKFGTRAIRPSNAPKGLRLALERNY